MTTTTKTYLITNRIACTILGFFEAASEDDAVLAMIRDAGYRDAAHEAEVLDSTVEKLRDELVVTEEDVPAAITALAQEMVRCYRVCGDDLTAADMIDDNAHHADDWDGVGVHACGVAAGLRGYLVDAIWRQHRDDLRDAYAAAWRAAVKVDLAARSTEESAEDAADGVPLRIVGGQRVDLDGVPHLLVGTLGCAPEHGDGTREADLLAEAGVLGERVALREEGCWAYPIRHDDRGLAVAACPEVAPYLAAA